jgi:hypothetical protein
VAHKLIRSTKRINRKSGLLDLVIVFTESALVKDDKAIFFAAFHAEGRNGEDDPSPADALDPIERKRQISVEGIYRQLVSSICDRGVCEIESAADYSAATQTGDKRLFHSASSSYVTFVSVIIPQKYKNRNPEQRLRFLKLF